MSLWIRRRDKTGRMGQYAVGLPWLLVVAMIGLALALLMPLIEWLRRLF